MSRAGSVLVGISYPAIVAFAVLLLFAVQLRSSGGAAYDTWRLNFSANRYLESELTRAHQQLRDKANRSFDELRFTDLCLKLYNEDGSLKSGLDPRILDEEKDARRAGKKPEEFGGELRCLLRGHVVLQYDKPYFQAQKDDFEKDIAALQKRIAANHDQYLDLIKGHEEFLAFREMENTGSWYLRVTVVTPYHLLLLLLVMLMGALGGIVRLLRDYGDPNRLNPASSDYFFVPLIGLVVAIGGYVLARTGLLLLSTTKEEASLSPYMVGLVGIISGLLAKDVIDALARAGANIVSNQNRDTTRTGAQSGALTSASGASPSTGGSATTGN